MRLDPYKNDIGMQIVRANRLGDIKFLQKTADSGQFDPLKITPSEKWSYLHRINMNPHSPSPLETVRFYLDKGVAVNAQDIYGMTPLHYAMRAGNGDAALALLEAGANPNIADEDNMIPLAMIGYMPERLDVLKAMLDSGANVHFFNGNETVIDSYRSDSEPELMPIVALMEQYA